MITMQQQIEVSRAIAPALQRPQIVIDRSQVDTFLQHFDGPNADEIFLALKDKGQASGKPVQWRARVDRILEQAARLQADGYGLFLAINKFRGTRRRSDALARIRVVWAEWDAGAMPDWPIAPSLIVESSPGKFHCYWFIDGPMTLAAFSGIMAAMVRLGSDPNAKDVARVLRIPGTWHMKIPAGQASPVGHMVRIVGGCGDRYTASELVEAFPAPQTTSARAMASIRRPLGTDTDGLQRFTKPLERLASDEYEVWIGVGMALHHESGGSADGLNLWLRWSERSSKFVEGECERRWRGFGSRAAGGRTGGFIYYAAGACSGGRHHGV